MPKTATDHQRIRVRRRSTTALNASLHIHVCSKKGSLHDMVHGQISVDSRNSFA